MSEEYDDKINIVSVTLIDLCHMELFKESDERDLGFIKGLQETIKMLTEIMNEQ